ncbi:MAG: DNA protecting protein DprA [Crocinitomix sp. MedPE-SWsnd]|nr:MAG: DNA protecting protein DprA [Crocinitomix sp. MedPE-SWsnd]
MVEERIYQIALSALNGLGPVKARLLLEAVGSLEGVFTEKEASLRKLEGFGSSVINALDREKAIARAKQEIEFIEENNVQLYYFQDQNFPQKLREINDCPIVLYALGKVDFNQTNISIVGMRKSTSYGKKVCDQLVADLAAHEAQIISGLAHGIDKVAHEAAIHNGLATIGVLGHGLDTMYPAAHRPLAKRMLENGGIATEFMSGVVGEPANFPKRNRIVAGLSEATVVIESSESGGSLITANLANDYNREVFAVPGPVDRETSKGCNNLIKRNRAHLISSADDLVKVLDWEEKDDQSKQHEMDALIADLNSEEQKIIQLIKANETIDFDSLAFELKLSSAELSLHIFNLEMKGLLQTHAGKRYSLA